MSDPSIYEFLAGGPFPLDPRPRRHLAAADAWAALRPHDPGFTWGFDELLADGTLSTTLDLVLATARTCTRCSPIVVGTHDRTRGGLHPSDHAGIVTTFSVR